MKAAAGSPGGPAVTVCAWPRSGGGRGQRVAVVWGGCGLQLASVRRRPWSAGGRGLGWPWSASGRGLGWPWSAVGFGPPVAAVCGSPGARRRPVRGADVGAESSFALSCASPRRVCLPGARPRPAGDSRCQAVQRLGSEVQQGRLCGVRCGSRRSLPRGRGRRGS